MKEPRSPQVNGWRLYSLSNKCIREPMIMSSQVNLWVIYILNIHYKAWKSMLSSGFSQLGYAYIIINEISLSPHTSTSALYMGIFPQPV